MDDNGTPLNWGEGPNITEKEGGGQESATAIDQRGQHVQIQTNIGTVVGPVISGQVANLVIYHGDRPVTVADVLDACRSQAQSMVDEARHKYDPALYVHRAIEQELNRFFDTPLDAGAANCYLIVAPAGSGKTNLLCHLAGERAGTQPAVLLMGGNLYLSPTSGLLGALQSELQAANRGVNFRSAEDCLHTLHRVAEETSRDALIILDAINEHDKPIEIRKAVEDLLRKTRDHRIKLVITCRDFYWGVFKGEFWEGATVNPLPAELAEDENGDLGSGDFSHFTLGEQEIALNLYLRHYQIVGQPMGDAVEQLRHPLLLRFFCEAYRGQEVGEVEDIRLKELFDRYWDQKLASVAERMIKHGDERIQEVLQEELGDYLMGVAAYMLRNHVRAIPEGDMLEATGLSERRGDRRSVYGRIRDEFIILEGRERGQGYRRVVQVAFVYEEFMEYTMARSLLRDWDVAGLDKDRILAAVDALVAEYASFAQVLGIMVYIALMLKERRGLPLWSALMSRDGPWRKVVLEAIRKLPDRQVDANVFLVLNEVLTLSDVELVVRVLDILTIGHFGYRAPRPIMLKVCDLANHWQESIRRRVMLAVRNAPSDLMQPVLQRGLRDPLRGVRENALTSTLSLPPESALVLLNVALHDAEARIRYDAIGGLCRLGKPAVESLVATLRDENQDMRKRAAEALNQLAWIPLSDADRGWYTMAMQDWTSCMQFGDCAVEPLMAALHDHDSGVRRQAVQVLGRLKHTRVVESLVEALRDSDEIVRWVAADTLGQIRDVSAVEPLVAALSDTDETVRRAAAGALGWLRWQPGSEVECGWYRMARQDWSGCVQLGQSAVKPLVAALRDSNWNVRRAAAGALGQIGDASAVKPLVAALRDSDETVRQETAGALVRIGVPTVGSLVAALRDRNERVRRTVVGVLGQIGDVTAVEPLVAVLRDNNEGVRRAAAGALGQIGHVSAVEPLVVALQDSQGTLRQEVADALVKIGSPIVEPLVAMLRHSDCGLRRQAAEVLGRLRDVRVVEPSEPLVEALRDSDGTVRRAAAGALGQIGEVWAVKPLVAALRDSDGTVRRTAASALEQLRWQPGSNEERGWYLAAARDWSGCVYLGQPAIVPLLEALRDSDETVRQASAGALGQIGDVLAVEPLREALRDSKGTVRRAAVSALEQLAWQPGSDEERGWYRVARQDWSGCVQLGQHTVKPLVAALQDSNWSVRRMVAGALGRLGDVRAVESLVTVLSDSNSDVRRAAAGALGQIGDARAVESLVMVLSDGSSDVRQAAAGALGQILGQIGDARASIRLAEALQDSDEGVRRMAAYALGQSSLLATDTLIHRRGVVIRGGRPRTYLAAILESLVAALGDTTDSVRSEVILTLALLEDRAIKALKPALSHQDTRIRTGAREALELIGTPAARAALAEGSD